MDATPAAGPSASIGKAHCQLVRWTTGGTSCIEIIVSRKPADVCSVSAVPTACGGTDSVTKALNCAESATTKYPQMTTSAINKTRPWPNTRGETRAQAPLAIIETVTSHSLPR